MVRRRGAGTRHHLTADAGPGPKPDDDRWGPLVAGLAFVAGLVLLEYALTTAVGR